jgi:signal transduction protein with GAF and PtsI domain
LSLSNEPDKLANMALDTLLQVLSVDCCWIQTITDRKHKKLNLAAERGFNAEIRQEIGTMDMGHSFSEQIIGLGHKIIIPDLSNDGLYGMPSFKNTGYKWLVAVPLMTYRVYGILGTASRNRKLLKKDTSELIMVIAGLIATSISKAHLSRLITAPEKPIAVHSLTIHEEPEAKPIKNIKDALQTKEAPQTAEQMPETPQNPPLIIPAKRPDSAFHSHARKMEQFRKAHR